MKTHKAECSCGSLAVACQGDPLIVSMCHCSACKRRTGSSFGVGAFYDYNRVKISGISQQFRRSSDSGNEITFHFCPDCGSTVFWKPDRLPDKIAVGAGFFADPQFPTPNKEVYPESRCVWLKPLD